VTASTRSSAPWRASRRRPSPVAAFTRCRPPSGGPLSNAGRDGGGPWSPARSIRRPSPSRRRTDRPGRLSCGFARIPSTFAGRAVPSGGCRPPDHPASALVRPLRHPSFAVASPLRFSCLASPLSDRTSAFRAPFTFTGRAGGDAARAGHSCLVFFGQRTFRARARAGSRGLAGVGSCLHRRRPWDLLITLRSLDPAVAGERAFFGLSRSGPPAVSPSRSAASSIDRGIRVLRRVVGPCRLRLLGFGPAGQPSPRGRRSRYSFCA
jgi:hypothetical protein